MTTQLKTLFGTYESEKDGITVSDKGGIGHSCRRQFALVNSETGTTLGSVDIQGANSTTLKEKVVGLLEGNGFRCIDNRSPA